jgi:hypothetical protein
MTLSLNQFLLLYNWFLIAALLLFLALIGRSYEKFSNKRTFYRFLVIPMLLFGVVSVRYAGLDQLTGDGLADFIFGFGGLMVLGLCWHLYKLMIVSTRG